MHMLKSILRARLSTRETRPLSSNDINGVSVEVSERVTPIGDTSGFYKAFCVGSVPTTLISTQMVGGVNFNRVYVEIA